MKIRGLLIATVAAAGMLGFSASAMAADYAIVLKTLSNPFWVQMKDGIEAKAKELGVEVDIALLGRVIGMEWPRPQGE